MRRGPGRRTSMPRRRSRPTSVCQATAPWGTRTTSAVTRSCRTIRGSGPSSMAARSTLSRSTTDCQAEVKRSRSRGPYQAQVSCSTWWSVPGWASASAISSRWSGGAGKERAVGVSGTLWVSRSASRPAGKASRAVAPCVVSRSVWRPGPCRCTRWCQAGAPVCAAARRASAASSRAVSRGPLSSRTGASPGGRPGSMTTVSAPFRGGSCGGTGEEWPSVIVCPGRARPVAAGAAGRCVRPSPAVAEEPLPPLF